MMHEKHKIIFVGDSHTRGRASELMKNLDKSYEVMGFVKPNAGAMVLIHTAKEEISKLTKEDMVIFWGGTNDVARNASSNGLTHIMESLMRNQHTNIILLNAPHRFDLGDSSCEDEEVRALNRKLSKIAKRFENISIVNVESQRHLFTRNGLHMNITGKKVMVKRLATVIPEIIGNYKKLTQFV
jgi:lysophospholipase L1-like esterase